LDTAVSIICGRLNFCYSIARNVFISASISVDCVTLPLSVFLNLSKGVRTIVERAVKIFLEIHVGFAFMLIHVTVEYGRRVRNAPMALVETLVRAVSRPMNSQETCSGANGYPVPRQL
jgi:hypothetical protein